MRQEKPKQVADVVAERIESLIMDSVLKPGQALPSERRLQEKLGVSRTALREGLKVLRVRGLVQTAQGKGSFVANLAAQPMPSPMMHLLGSQPRTIYDLLEVRALLEGESARLAAERGTRADFVLIERRYRELEDAGGKLMSPSAHARLDHAFHLAICEASHNPILVHTLSSLTDLMLSSVYVSVKNLYHRPVQKQTLDKQHALLFRAVTGRKPVAARKAAQQHIASVLAELRDIEHEEERLVRATLRLDGWE